MKEPETPYEKAAKATIFEPVKKQIANQSLPYEVKFPKYIPFEYEESNVFLYGWDKKNKDVVTHIRYLSIEGYEQIDKNTSKPQQIPHVDYMVSNFERNYSTASESNDHEEIEINEGFTALFTSDDFGKNMQLIWYKDGMEFTLEMNNCGYLQDGKAELIKIAKSI
ncbi:hypothetical protein [Aquibacillus albus]|uniref:DUF4367 domain-containing protein n=1 Tax=Aquibacillus albus TaxID=1168171 RepID=A0ABS2N2Q1_9BACI|nr:hypothetical protein [Aquibacillus albus]MBM7572369.1 hypothetical protein [Aquibacillus albus]